MCGSQSETQIPLWPCCFHFRCEASSGERPSPIGVITGLKLGGSGWPASRFSSGLGSNVSMWLGPPSMNRKMTLLAVAGRRHGASEPPATGSPAPVPAASVAAPAGRRAPAPPKPAPACKQPVAAGQRRHRAMRRVRIDSGTDARVMTAPQSTYRNSLRFRAHGRSRRAPSWSAAVFDAAMPLTAAWPGGRGTPRPPRSRPGSGGAPKARR